MTTADKQPEPDDPARNVTHTPGGFLTAQRNRQTVDLTRPQPRRLEPKEIMMLASSGDIVRETPIAGMCSRIAAASLREQANRSSFSYEKR